MIDYIRNFKSVDFNKILIKNRDQVNEKLQKLIDGGYDKLQVISDFDKTITKQHVNGKPQFNVFDILRRCPSIPKDVIEKVKQLTAKYSVLDKDPDLSHAERKKLMSEWWTKSAETYRGVKISKEEIEKVTLDIGVPVRDNAKQFFDQLKEGNVPVLLLSAGIGDAVEPLLKVAEIKGSNIQVVANYLKWDNEGKLEGYQAMAIHSANKNDYDIKNTEFYKKSVGRKNVLILGDNLGDADMAQRLDNVDNILKIGFSYKEAEEVLPTWLNTFDIVLKDDQTMDVPRAILQLLAK